MSTKLSPGTQAVTSRCDVCGAANAVARIFMDGPRSRYRTWRNVDYLRPVNRAIGCTDCGCTRETKTTIFPKPKEPVEIRQNIVTGIKRLKERGWTLFEGDPRWRP